MMRARCKSLYVRVCASGARIRPRCACTHQEVLWDQIMSLCLMWWCVLCNLYWHRECVCVEIERATVKKTKHHRLERATRTEGVVYSYSDIFVHDDVCVCVCMWPQLNYMRRAYARRVWTVCVCVLHARLIELIIWLAHAHRRRLTINYAQTARKITHILFNIIFVRTFARASCTVNTSIIPFCIRLPTGPPNWRIPRCSLCNEKKGLMKTHRTLAPIYRRWHSMATRYLLWDTHPG